MACPKRRKPKRDRNAEVGRAKAKISAVMEPLSPEARRRVADGVQQRLMADVQESLVELKEKGLVEQDDQDRWKLTPEAREHEARRKRLQSEHDRLTAEIADLDTQISNVDMTLMESHPDDDDLPLDERRFRVGTRSEGDGRWRDPTPDATALRTFMITEGLLEPDPDHPRRWRATPKALEWGKSQRAQYPRWYGAMEVPHGNG